MKDILFFCRAKGHLCSDFGFSELMWQISDLIRQILDQAVVLSSEVVQFIQSPFGFGCLCDISGQAMGTPIRGTTLRHRGMSMLMEITTTTDIHSCCRKKEV